MTAHLKPYPAYRDSGVEWLAKVPEHWEIRRLATVADMRVSSVDKHIVEGEHPVRLCNYVDVYHCDRITADIPFMIGTARAREARRFRLAVGDVLVTKDSEDWTDIGVPSLVEYAARDLICGYHIAMLRSRGPCLDGAYLFHALRVREVRWQCQVAAVGVTRYGLSRNSIRGLRIPIPSSHERRAIALYLDQADERIRRYVRAKKRLIELLEEHKKVLIQQAVTGQVDVRTGRPYPGYKDSGMDWLGKIPSHWPMARVGAMFRQRKEPGPVGLPILEVSLNTGVRPREFSPSARKQVMRDRSGYQRACEGDIAYNTMRMWQGAVGIVPSDGLISPAYVVATPSPGVSAEFFCALLRTRSYRHGIDMRSRGIVKDRNRLYWEDFRQLPVPLPCAEEQRAIAAWLVEAGTGWRRGAECVRSQIALAEELRTRLISDVATGKLDVRGVAPLPESEAGIEAMVEEESA